MCLKRKDSIVITKALEIEKQRLDLLKSHGTKKLKKENTSNYSLFANKCLKKEKTYPKGKQHTLNKQIA